jgi:DNA-binding response OmpR family regulator
MSATQLRPPLQESGPGIPSDCRPLIVEDDPGDARLLVEAFWRIGVPAANLRIIHDGEKAVFHLAALLRDRLLEPRSRLPSFIVLDLRLRRRAGMSVLEWVRSAPLLRPVPVMILTGTERSEDVLRAKELGADSFYAKPLAFGDLIATVGAMRARWRALREVVIR